MKYSAAIAALAVSPVVLAKSVHNVFPADVEVRDQHLKEVVKQVSGGSATQVIVIWVNNGGGAATSTVNQQVTVTKTVTAGATGGAAGTGAAGAMATHSVVVGGAAGLQFSPPEIKANLGDMVVFTFQNANHSVTQSTFDLPCDPMAGGMDSGFQPNQNNTINPPPQVAMQVMDTKPLCKFPSERDYAETHANDHTGFYCKQNGHCGKGMVFSVNPTADKTGALFQSKAIQQKGKGAGSGITGNSTSSAVAAPGGGATASAVVGGGAAASSAVASSAGAVATGIGAFDPATGVCTCAVSVGAGAFPAQVQGVGAMNGFGGALPLAMMERSP